MVNIFGRRRRRRSLLRIVHARGAIPKHRRRSLFRIVHARGAGGGGDDSLKTMLVHIFLPENTRTTPYPPLFFSTIHPHTSSTFTRNQRPVTVLEQAVSHSHSLSHTQISHHTNHHHAQYHSFCLIESLIPPTPTNSHQLPPHRRCSLATLGLIALCNSSTRSSLSFVVHTVSSCIDKTPKKHTLPFTPSPIPATPTRLPHSTPPGSLQHHLLPRPPDTFPLQPPTTVSLSPSLSTLPLICSPPPFLSLSQPPTPNTHFTSLHGNFESRLARSTGPSCCWIRGSSRRGLRNLQRECGAPPP